MLFMEMDWSRLTDQRLLYFSFLALDSIGV